MTALHWLPVAYALVMLAALTHLWWRDRRPK